MVSLVCSLTYGLGAMAVFVLWRTCISLYLSPLRVLRGPPCPSPFYGHVHHIFRAGNYHTAQKWVAEYGNNVFCRWLIPCLWTADPQAIRHVLQSGNFIKPWEFRLPAARVVGNSVLVAEGVSQCAANPAFGPAQVRELVPIFVDKSAELRDVWMEEISAQSGCARINVIAGLKKMTLDVIGLAGFDYDLQALRNTDKPNELYKAFHQIFNVTPPVSLRRIITDSVPFLGFLADEYTLATRHARAVMQRIGHQLIQQKKAAIMRERAGTSGEVETKDVHGRDLLTLLIKANMATDVPDAQRLTDEQVLSRAFLVAGHETTSTAAAWCLYALSHNRGAQEKLREELLAAPTVAPTMDDLAALPYLDHVLRETMRLYAPVALMIRAAQRDDVIPTSEPVVDRDGRVLHGIRIGRGNRVIISVLALNRSSAIWGEDALEFRPERWDNPPEGASNIPGVWGNSLAFSGGVHACIGFRFSVVELKALIFTLVRAFTFEFAADPADVTTIGMFTQRPALQSEVAKGAQLPFLIRPYVVA
ncbi:cytochrome P450 [Trametes gibbosa]|nr:cytochrome P450 [Trametes gibbosa]